MNLIQKLIISNLSSPEIWIIIIRIISCASLALHILLLFAILKIIHFDYKKLNFNILMHSLKNLNLQKDFLAQIDSLKINSLKITSLKKFRVSI